MQTPVDAAFGVLYVFLHEARSSTTTLTLTNGRNRGFDHSCLDVVMRTQSSVTGSREAVPSNPSFFSPKATIFCEGEALFRTRAARNLGCLLDLDPDVESWRCLAVQLPLGDQGYLPDVLVKYRGGRHRLLDATDLTDPMITIAAGALGYEHRFVSPSDLDGFRLRNAVDLLRYGNYQTPLGDRIRILATLDEYGSIRLADALTLFREVLPMAGLASLVLRRVLSIELDEALIGPDTLVRLGSE